MLEPIAGGNGSSEFRAEVVDWSRFAGMKVEPVILRMDVERRERFSEEELAKLQTETHGMLEELFGERFAIAGKPEAGVACLRVAITDIDEVKVGLNTVTSILAVPVDNGGVSVELEIIDSLSRERLYAFAGYKVGKVIQVKGYFSRLGNAKSGLRAIAESTLEAIRPPPSDG